MKGIKAMAVPMPRATALHLDHHQQLLLPLQHQIELAPAAVPVRSSNRHPCASSFCKACCSAQPPMHRDSTGMNHHVLVQTIPPQECLDLL